MYMGRQQASNILLNFDSIMPVRKKLVSRSIEIGRHADESNSQHLHYQYSGDRRSVEN